MNETTAKLAAELAILNAQRAARNSTKPVIVDDFPRLKRGFTYKASGKL